MACQIVPEYLEILYDSMVSLGGGIFRGVQQSFLDGSGRQVEPLILFDDSESRFSIAMPASKVSAYAVIAAIREKRQQIAKWFQQVA
jgi:hypothetical protein